MDPYEANPDRIPSTDRYADAPSFGRYSPNPTDFRPDERHVNSTTPDSLEYWSQVLQKCTASNRIYESQDGGRDVFALGSIIIKSSHLKSTLEGRKSQRDYSYADANEVKAIGLAEKALGTIEVPKVYFAAKINGRDVFVQERIPGVALCVAWQYLSQTQKQAFKVQARSMLHDLSALSPPAEIKHRSYIVPDLNPVEHRGIQRIEADILFAGGNKDPDISFMHNDVTLSNIIVDDNKIVGLIDWEMAGFFGWKTAAKVHARIRTPKRENFAALNLPEEILDDVLFWNDLYEMAW